MYSTDIQLYLNNLPEDRVVAYTRLLEVIDTHLPKGFCLVMQYNMPTWVVSLDDYPAGYHCTPHTPLPFLSLANQKSFISLYHMGLYADENLLNWFKEEYAKFSSKKLDVGKSCVRFKNNSPIAFDLIAELCQKISPNEWISIYESRFKK